jgi:hypothetical protein
MTTFAAEALHQAEVLFRRAVPGADALWEPATTFRALLDKVAVLDHRYEMYRREARARWQANTLSQREIQDFERLREALHTTHKNVWELTERVTGGGIFPFYRPPLFGIPRPPDLSAGDQAVPTLEELHASRESAGGSGLSGLGNPLAALPPWPSARSS